MQTTAAPAPPAKVQLTPRLRAIMDAWPVGIESGCRSHLEQLISKTEREAGPSLSSVQVLEAEINFRKLLGEMTLAAGRMGYAELHEPTFFEALAKLCPIWPFC